MCIFGERQIFSLHAMLYQQFAPPWQETVVGGNGITVATNQQH
jgi:hypothetical protein